MSTTKRNKENNTANTLQQLLVLGHCRTKRKQENRRNNLRLQHNKEKNNNKYNPQEVFPYLNWFK